KENVQKQETKIDLKGAFLILITLSGFLLFLLEGGQKWPWLSWQNLVFLLLILFFALWTYKVESKAKNAIMPMALWKNKTLANTSLAMMSMGIVMMGPETFLPTFGQASLG